MKSLEKECGKLVVMTYSRNVQYAVELSYVRNRTTVNNIFLNDSTARSHEGSRQLSPSPYVADRFGISIINNPFNDWRLRFSRRKSRYLSLS
ncbi:hypothetical protein CEXT_567471 [Caerostris extrusa]|uniref:Uncharacterized protein n=1 Tax=Caerostris extrusa TaxID=172846 RepID=A0AAV4WZ28_CAEEX|nr:hypothetical protein CEXT_567471 [Caerostris extrusa]